MTRSKKTTLAEYGGLADLAAARKGKGAQADPTTARQSRAAQPDPEPASDQGDEAPAKRDIQISAFIPADAHRRVKIALAEDGLTMRELVCKLLDQWLAGR